MIWPVRIQLWSYNYDPEPLGIAPVSTIWAKAMAARGYEVDVVAAHPHYPKPEWGSRVAPYREVRDGIPVTRLPLVVGRSTSGRRMLQELSFLAVQTLACPFLGQPDAIISVSPSFPALLPAMLASKTRRIPWYIWLQDILPDGAATTGYIDRESWVYRFSRRLESSAYDSARGIVVLSESFRDNLRAKGVPDSKMTLAYNPATIPVESVYPEVPNLDAPRILCIGNIGKSQGLTGIVKDFEASETLAKRRARLVITGTGVAEEEVRSVIRSDRVEMTGLLPRRELEAEFRRATLAAVTQSYDDEEFNVPSKLMNYLAAGLPVIASVRPESEAARIVETSQSGWIAGPGDFGSTVEAALSDPDLLVSRSRNATEFSSAKLAPEALADRFDDILQSNLNSRESVHVRYPA